MPPGSAVHHEPLLPQLPEVLLDLLLETQGFGAQNFGCCHSETQCQGANNMATGSKITQYLWFPVQSSNSNQA